MLDSGCDVSVQSWLQGTDYPASRIAELLELDGAYREGKHDWCKSFMKDEPYDLYKQVRAINSRSDEFKVRTGPIFKLIEKAVFELPYFIKKVPYNQRPQYIMDNVYADGATYVATDYTSFEALFTKDLMEDVELILYKYMSKHVEGGREWYDIVERALTGPQKCVFKHITVECNATRMSGDMCTSLGNGFANLMLMLFCCEENGNTNVRGVVEGDDGLFSMDGPRLTSKMFSDLGLNIKLEHHSELNKASFCGLIFDEFDRINVTNPMKMLCSFGWTSALYARSNSKKLRMLVRAKSLSIAYQFPGCPILSALAQYGLRVTSGVDVRHYATQSRNLNMWQRDILLEALKNKESLLVEPPIRTRALVHEAFGIAPDRQIAIEGYLNGLNELTPLRIDLDNQLWRQHHDDYVRSSPLELLNRPIIPGEMNPRDKNALAHLYEQIGNLRGIRHRTQDSIAT